MRITSIALLVAVLTVSGCDAGRPAPAPMSEPVTTPAAEESYWKLDTDTNAVTGEVTKTAYLRFQGKQNIYVRKRGKKLECYINTDVFLETVANMHSRISTVQYRFDTGKPIRQGWSISDDNEALFYPGNPRPFLAQLSKAKTLAFEYRPADKLPDTIVLNVSGFPDAFSK